MVTVSTPNPSAELALDDLLELLREYRWTMHLFGPRGAPEIYAAVRSHRTHSDVVLLRSEKSASAYRVASLAGRDLFAPSVVTWQYHSTPTWTLRAALTLPAPFTPGAPTNAEPAHPLCTVPAELRGGQRTTRRTGLNQPPGWSWF